MAKSAAKTLSRRVLVELNRDPMTKTSQLVFEHEIPLLEAVHGEGTVRVVEKASEQLDEKYKQRKNDIESQPPSKHLGLGDVFEGDPRLEYDRLIAVYGMHPEVKMPVVEYVYGRFQGGQFGAVVQSGDLEDLTRRQLQHKLEGYKIPVPPGMPIEDMRKAVAAEMADA
jgi:hypothetical protein